MKGPPLRHSEAGGPLWAAPVLDVDEICPPGSAERRELAACLAQMFRETVADRMPDVLPATDAESGGAEAPPTAAAAPRCNS